MANAPLKKFSAGRISAAIWENITEANGSQKTYPVVVVEKSYKDKKGEWKSTHSFGKADLAHAVLVLQKSLEFLALRESS